MLTRKFVLATSVALFGTLAANAWTGASAPQDPGVRRLRPVTDQDPAPRGAAPGSEAAPVDTAMWREALSDPDHVRRERAYDQLVARARTEPALRGMLQAWRDGGGELGWTARLMLRELGRDPLPARQPTRSLDPFGRTAPRGGADPFGGTPFGAGDPFQAHRERIERMMREMEQMFDQDPFGGLDPFDGADPFDGLRGLQGMPGAASSVSVRQGPDGVTVEVTERGPDGATQRRSYSGESLEDVVRANPELQGKVGLGPGGGVTLREHVTDRAFDQDRAEQHDHDHQRDETSDSASDSDFQFDSDSSSSDGSERAGDRDGAEDAVRGLRRAMPKMLGVRLDRDAGTPGKPLVVRAVEPGSLAEHLGVKVGDELTHLGGRRLVTIDDIAKALEEAPEDAPLSVGVVDRDGKVAERKLFSDDR